MFADGGRAMGQLESGSGTVKQTAASLRSVRRRLRAQMTPIELQDRAISALCRIAERWLSDLTGLADNDLSTAELAVEYSLVPLLQSVNAGELNELIDRERVRGAIGPELIGHVIAGNTPLVGITTVMRALLVGSSSLLKLPSKAQNPWLQKFLGLLANADDDLAALTRCLVWTRGDTDRTSELLADSDLVVIYGADRTIREITQLQPSASILAYGHRLSIGIVMSGSDFATAANGLSKDILLYDQQGCLSVHTIFFEGDASAAQKFAEALCAELLSSTVYLPRESAARTWAIQETIDLVVMDRHAQIVGRQGTRWAVVTQHRTRIHASCTHGVVYVVPAVKEGIIECISNAAPIIQGAALAAGDSDRWIWFQNKLLERGASRVCRPGELQQPAFSWREDGRDVLASLLPAERSTT